MDSENKKFVCAAAYTVMASCEILKNHEANSRTKKKRHFWVDTYYKSRCK